METSLRADEEIVRVYNKYSDMVYRIAFLMLENSAEAEDILQNVFIKYIKINKNFESDEHLKAWLIVCAKNAAKDVLKSFWHRKKVSIESVGEHILSESMSTEKSDVYLAVMRLKDKYRVPLYLHYYEGYKTYEIAKILSLNHATVRSRLRTARQKLKLYLEEEE